MSPGQPGRLRFGVATRVGLAGLEGRFGIEGGGVRITGLEAIGAAAGMQLAWEASPDGGAQFVLFTTDTSVVEGSGGLLPVLAVEVEQIPGTTPGRITFVKPGTMLASDLFGNKIPICPHITTEYPPGNWAGCARRTRCATSTATVAPTCAISC